VKTRIAAVVAALSIIVAAGFSGLALGTVGGPNPNILYGGGGNGGFTCYVQANYAHPSNSQPGYASADGFTDCSTQVDVIKSSATLLIGINGRWTNAGDQDGVWVTKTNNSHVTATSKNPCRGGYSYIGAQGGYVQWSGYVVLNGTDVNYGPYGNGQILC